MRLLGVVEGGCRGEVRASVPNVAVDLFAFDDTEAAGVEDLTAAYAEAAKDYPHQAY